MLTVTETNLTKLKYCSEVGASQTSVTGHLQCTIFITIISVTVKNIFLKTFRWHDVIFFSLEGVFCRGFMYLMLIHIY